MEIASKPVQNLIQVSHVTAPEPIEIHRGFSVTHPHPKHWHDEFHVCAITGGAGYIEHGGSAHFTPKGALIVVAPARVHANNASEPGCSYENIYVPPEMMKRAADLAQGVAEFPLVTSAPDVYANFLRLMRYLLHGTELQREAATLEFFAGLIQKLGRGQIKDRGIGEPHAVRVVREFLDENYDREVGLAELAAITEMSPFHLNRAFRKQLGLPPHAYQVQLRISRAKALLRESWPIVEVASRTGFADQSHLTRHFKRSVGVTPGQFAGRFVDTRIKRKNVQDLSASAD